MYARLLIIANVLALGVYVFFQGFYRFYMESFGTWMLSPLILLRLSPTPMKQWFLHMNAKLPVFSDLICIVPIVMIVTALVLATWSSRKGSLPGAIVACTLLTTVFVVYHSVKHLGMSLVLY